MSSTASSTTSTTSAPLGFIIASKDRAWQLAQLLRSIDAVQNDLPDDARVQLRSVVIYAASSEAHHESYRKLSQQYQQVEFRLETKVPANSAGSTATTTSDASSTSTAPTFIDHVFSVLTDFTASSIRHVMFGVDDMIFYDSAVPFSDMLTALDQDDQLLTVQLALHPQVTFCHPANKQANVPIGMKEITATTTKKEATTAAQSTDSCSLLRFIRMLGSCDWNYPFSLCGSIYRMSDTMTLLSIAETEYGRTKFSHPNTFEVIGNQCTMKTLKVNKVSEAGETSQKPVSTAASVPLAALRPYSACPSRPIMSVITVNRVQDLFANPIYSSATTSTASSSSTASFTAATVTPFDSSTITPVSTELTADELLAMSLAQPRLEYDIAAYRTASCTFNSVHIGEFLTRQVEQ